ncbi:proton-conducting transporter transmembrane domain-containing protein [Thermodesulfobium sp.]
MIFYTLSIVCFLLGIISFFNNKLSCIFAVLGSVFSIAVGILGFERSLNILNLALFPDISLKLGVDKISSIFLIIAFLCFGIIVFYSIDFNKLFSKRMSLLLNIAMLAMLFILTSQDAISFLISFECISIAIFFSILERRNTYKEAFSFLAFSEASSIALFIAFGALWAQTENFIISNAVGNIVFMGFAYLAFIIKMDIVPFHVWISSTYSKSPSNVAAILSVPVTLIGTYGIFRIFALNPHLQVFAIISILLGSISALWGALQAARSRSLKKLPAYSTIENNSLILASIGIAYLTANAQNLQFLSQFAMLTALFIIISHSFSKTTLFLSIGHAKEAFSEELIDNVGGVFKYLSKITGLGIVISGLSLSAFPPLIGFVSDWMLLETFFQSYKIEDLSLKLIVTFSAILITLAIGLSSFGMKKLIGFSALGTKTKEVINIESLTMKISEAILIFLVITLGFISPLIIIALGYHTFLDGLLAVPNPLLIVSSRPIFGVLSPTLFGIIIFIFFIALWKLKSKEKDVKRVKPWVGGLEVLPAESFKIGAYSFIVESLLKPLSQTREIRENDIAYVYSADIIENFYSFITKLSNKISSLFSKTIMNSSIHWYITYIISAFIITLLYFKFTR